MDPSTVTKQHPESGRLYQIVTRYWPRIAVVLVFAIGTAEWVIGGLTADSDLEVYLLAWAALTAGLWFLFEKAERALSEEASAQVAIGDGGYRPVRAGPQFDPGLRVAVRDLPFVLLG